MAIVWDEIQTTAPIPTERVRWDDQPASIPATTRIQWDDAPRSLTQRLVSEAGEPLGQRVSQFGQALLRPTINLLPGVMVGRALAAFRAKQELQAGKPERAQRLLESQRRERELSQRFPAARGLGEFVGGFAPISAGLKVTQFATKGLQPAIQRLPLLWRALVRGLEFAPTAATLGAVERGTQAVTEGIPTTPRDVVGSAALNAVLAVPMGAVAEVIGTAGRAINLSAYNKLIQSLEQGFLRENPSASQQTVEQFRAAVSREFAARGIHPSQGVGVLRSALMRRRIRAGQVRFPQVTEPPPQGQAKPSPAQTPQGQAGPLPTSLPEARAAGLPQLTLPTIETPSDQLRKVTPQDLSKEVQFTTTIEGKTYVEKGTLLALNENTNKAVVRLSEVPEYYSGIARSEVEKYGPDTLQVNVSDLSIRTTDPPIQQQLPGTEPALPSGKIQPPQLIQESAGPKQTPVASLVRIRTNAIQAVTRELSEQARILSTESALLKRRVLESGGIKSTLAGGLTEELRAIRPFLRQKGREIDDLATELGFEDGEALRQALITVQQAKRPTLAQLRQQATQIIDSEGGNRIVEALQTKGATGQAIRRVVREVTQQTETEVSRGLRTIRGLLRGAERKALTPTQIARVAREQRITPGATVAGPRGGAREAPLAPEEIAQVERRIGGIVPRRPEITGQPPRIPRKKALVLADFAQHPFKDLTEFQAVALSGLDPRRAARLVDGKDFGPVRQFILDPAQEAARAGRAAGQRDLAQLHVTVPHLRPVSRLARGPQESEQLFDLIEGRLDPKAITPRLNQAAGIMRETYDRLLGELNQARIPLGKVPIQRRENYITHIQTLNLLDDFYYGLNNVPDDAFTIPTLITHPNSPFFQFALKRLGGPHAKDAVEAFTRYVVKANAVIAHAPVLQATRPLVQFLPPRAQGYFTQYLDEVLALKKEKADTLAPRPVLNAIGLARRQIGGGAILGNLSSVFNQLWTSPATIARVGPLRAVGAGGELLAATGKDILNRLILRVGARDYAQAVLDLHKPDVRDFIDQHSPLMQNRRFEIEFDPATMRRLDKVLGALITSVDHEMVRLAWLAQFRKSAREGKAFANAVREAEETAFLTQSGYTPEDLPPAFRSQLGGAFAQFQNSINNVFNFLRFDVGIQPLSLAFNFRGHVRDHPAMFKQALLFFGTVYAMKMLYDHAGIPSAVDGPEDLIPLWGMAEYGPPAFWSPADAVLSLTTADTPFEQAKATAKLKRAAFLLLGRGGNQLRKTLDGIIGISRGGKFDKRGRLLFPIEGTPEQTRAVLFGIYGTKAGQTYVRSGFKPVQASIGGGETTTKALRLIDELARRRAEINLMARQAVTAFAERPTPERRAARDRALQAVHPDSRTQLQRKAEQAVRFKKNPLALVLLRATSNEQKVAILQDARSQFTFPSEYQRFLNDMRRARIISLEVVVQARKPKLGVRR